MDNPSSNHPLPSGPSPASAGARPPEWALQGERLPGGKVTVDGKMVIGRGQGCDLVLAEPYLSRQHVSIQVAEGCLQVEDLGSANGTFINGERISRSEAHPGDEIRLDQLVFTVLGPEATQLRDPDATAPHVSDDREHTALLAGTDPAPEHTQLLSVSKAYLIGEEGAATDRFELVSGINRLGRAADNEIVLDEPSVSAHHAELVERDGGWMLTDLQSTNGTFVNEHRIDNVLLHGGEPLRMGQVRLRFVWELPLAGAAQAPKRTAGSGGKGRKRLWWQRLWFALLLLAICGAGALYLLARSGWPG